ncbi:hypothetical protein J6590_104335, partial [Homalodisca vitripennis]
TLSDREDCSDELEYISCICYDQQQTLVEEAADNSINEIADEVDVTRPNYPKRQCQRYLNSLITAYHNFGRNSWAKDRNPII